MGDLKEILINYFRLNKSKKTLEELKKEFKIKGEEDLKLLIDSLNELEIDGNILKIKDLYCASTDEFMVGTISLSSNGLGYVKNGEQVIIIDNEKLGNALDNDLVLIKKLYIKNNEIYGQIAKTLKSGNKQIIGVIKSNYKIYPHKSNNTNSLPIDSKGYVPGELILIDTEHMEIIKSIGHIDDPDIDIVEIAYKYGFNTDFSSEYMEEIKSIPNEPSEKRTIKYKNPDTKEIIKKNINDYENRVDLRNKTIFTIDGIDTKDMDDAVSIEILENGNYKLGVHIADVSHYINYGSEIFNEAYNRGTSVYMDDTVEPMFHHKISNGICSLNPNCDRLTKTVEMIYDSKGNMLDYKIYKSVINSNKKMNYTALNEILENKKMVDGYEPYLKELYLMAKLSELLEQKKIDRGYIRFSIPQIKTISSDEGVNYEIQVQKTAEKIIENFMLAANETVASHIYWMGLPFIYRVHEEPDENVMKSIVEYLNANGLNIKTYNNLTSTQALSNILKQLEGTDELAIFQEMLRNGLKKAKYNNNNIGHFALNLDIYTHFTSPIRRLSDLIVHMLLDKYLENDFDFEFGDLDELLNKAAHQASVKEVNAIKASEEALLMKMAEYMENHIGEEYTAIISAITPAGIYIKTTDYIPGRINMFDMTDDYYYYDNKNNALIGKHYKNSFHIGDKITCIVSGASKENRTINFKDPQIVYTKRKVLSYKA